MGKGLLREEQGVEPLAMKIMAGVILLVIGLGIGYGIYTMVGRQAIGMLSFSVNVSPSSTTIGIPDSGDNTKNVTVSVERIGTYDQSVTLTAEGQPTGVNVSFSPASGTPTFGSTMTITVSSTASVGTTTITIKATGTDDTQQSATLELTLE